MPRTTMMNFKNCFKSMMTFALLALCAAADQTNLRAGSSYGADQLAHGSANASWSSTDPCSLPMQSRGCLMGVTCNVCLTRPGCAIEASTGNCVSVNRTTAVVGVELFTAGSVNYCDANDDACTACGADGRDGVCRGANSCICIHQCEIREPQYLQCGFGGSNRLYYMLAAIGVLAPLSVYFQVRRARGLGSAYGMPVFLRHMMRLPRREPGPMSLKLDGWRHYMEEHKEDFENIELKQCQLQLQGPCDVYYINGTGRPAPSQHALNEAELEEGRKQRTATRTRRATAARSHVCRFPVASTHEDHDDTDYTCVSTPTARGA
ncbi:hypothetical protein PINS_up003616 [Pythium insidiosum]|nr:hypothetical protein PINS_up003616 [Pythium insidiosum]